MDTVQAPRPVYNPHVAYVSDPEMFLALRAGYQFGPTARPLTLREAALNLYWANYGMGPSDQNFNMILSFFEVRFNADVQQFYSAYAEYVSEKNPA
jgi:hypothetical protein